MVLTLSREVAACFARCCRRMLPVAVVAWACVASAAEDDRILLGDGFFRRGMYDLAVQEYQAVPTNALTPAVLLRKGECLRRLGKPQEADAVYCQILESYDKGVERYFAQLQRAVLAMEANRLEAALASFDALTGARFPTDVRQAALYHCGECFEKLKQPAKAIESYENLLKIEPVSDYTGLGRLRLAALLARSEQKDNIKRAEELYKTAAADSSSSLFAADALVNLARLATAQGNVEGAAKFYLELRERFPQEAITREMTEQAALACLTAERGIEALGIIETALPSAEGELKRRLLLLQATAFRKLGRFEQAVAAYDVFLKTYPNAAECGDARYGQILALFMSAQYAKTIAAVKAFALPPAELEDDLLWLRVQSAEKLNDRAQAVEACRQLAARHPDSPFAPRALYLVGWLAQSAKDWTEAATAYEELATKFPKVEQAPQALLAAGVCRERSGDFTGAFRSWARLLAEYPDSPVAPGALFRKAMLEVSRKEHRAAALSLDELLKRFPKFESVVEASFWRGVLWRQEGELEKARGAFQQVLAGKAPLAVEREARFQLGLTLQKLGREEEAAELFQALLAADTVQEFDADCLIWLAEYQLARKDAAAADTAARVLLNKWKSAQHQQIGQALAGRAAVLLGQREAALAAYRAALAQRVQTAYAAEAALALGNLLAEGGTHQEAEKFFRDAIGFSAEQPAVRAKAYLGLARSAAASGQADRAVRNAMSVAVLFDDPTLVPAALDLAAEQLVTLGRRDEAGKALAELQKRYPDSEQARRRRAAP